MTRAGLVVADLTVELDGGRVRALRGVSFEIGGGESFGLVGESGSGKSMTCRAILGLLPPKANVEGTIRYGGRELLELSDADMQALRGSQISMIFQDPMSHLNPLLPVGTSIAQVLQAHDHVDSRTARRQAVHILERVGIRNANTRASAYPHQFSGGMRQRVLIGMALAARPGLLLADEPTTALDVIVQAGILGMFRRLREEDGMTLLLVSHDFAVVAGLCDRIGVMYAGQIVEEGPTREVLFNPSHPYTIALIQSVPSPNQHDRLRAIPGSPPDPGVTLPGCAFAPRCPLATPECSAGAIPLADVRLGHRSRCIHVDQTQSLRTAMPSVSNAPLPRPGES